MSAVGDDYSFQSKPAGLASMDNGDMPADGRPFKKFQKSSTEGNLTLRRPGPDALTASSSDVRSNLGSRRRQPVKDQKSTQAPAALHSSPSKRVSYYNAQRAAGTGPLHSRQTSANRPPSYQFGSASKEEDQDNSDNSASLDFLPSVNFDDFHASLTSDEPSVGLFPKRNRAPALLDSAFPNIGHDTRPGTKVPLKAAGSIDTGSRIGRTGSLLRRHNSQSRTAPFSREAESVSQLGEAAGGSPSRRQQLPPPTSNINVFRSPRKSVGPGIIARDLTAGLESNLRPRRGVVDDSHNSSPLKPSNNIPTPRVPGGNSAVVRQNKTKSLHLPSGSMQDPFASPLHTPDSTLSSFTGARSPGRPSLQRTMTPSSGKRMSVMPNSAHATGLAARTISPTDARRLKRMSVMPNAPPMPYTPPTPQPENTVITEPLAPSPALVLRKSLTPTSSRTTPEHNRKSYSSGISSSSTTSYNSCQSSTGAVRMSQSTSTSRLPMLKTRHDPLPIGAEEGVPPVPAIPKAYESPKTEMDQPFFASRKSSLANDNLSLHSVSTTDGIPTPSTDNENYNLPRKGSLKKSRPSDVGSTSERRPDVISNRDSNRRTLQPLRLPPMNLLPLSLPTAAKIAALYDGSGSIDSGSITPPPRVGPKGIPSTPMTASRASFFAKSQQKEEPMPVTNRLRSSSSHHALRSESSSHNGGNSSASTITDVRDGAVRAPISPFVSSSLPKTGGHFGYPRRDQNTAGLDAGSTSDSRPSRMTGPHFQMIQRAAQRDTSSVERPSPAETGTPSFGTSIRRKLSLTRKRSGSKSQSRAGSEDEAPPKPPKHDNMPPPRLPASATWNGPLMPSPSPTQKNNHAPARRKVSNPITPAIDRTRSFTWTSDGSPQEPSTPSENAAATTAAKRTLRATLEGGFPTPNSMSLKEFLKEAKNVEPQLDRDDQQAEDEMKKLASKRKDTENAAKELDALQRRATVKERVSTSQALRMVQLNIFERGEIVDYRDIYFCGLDNAKKHVGDLSAETANFGYDDERGDYNIVKGDHLAYRYEIIDILGKGSFGQVVRCIDHRTGGLVAIKIIRNKKRFHQQALVEVDILQKLRDWDPRRKHSMVQFTQSFYFRGHLCISTELLGMNLYEFIKCHEFRGFSLKLIRRFAKQLLSSLVLLKSHKVIHCDLKPENILLAHPARSEIKVIDFGSSCMENEKVYTYIQSRFYRSPEVILGMTYGMPIDMWSLGCILAELLTGYPIFPGENEQEQLACIMEVFGPPEKHLIEKSTRKKLFFDSLGKPRLTVSSKGKRRRPSSKTVQQVLKCEDETFLDFITRCLRWDPERRLKPDEAVHHEFITGAKPAAKAFNAATRTFAPPQAATTRTAQPQTASTTNSPAKRLTSIQTPSTIGGIRPLPDPPTTAIKVNVANTANAMNRNRDAASFNNTASPSKAAATASHNKRQSAVNNLQQGNTSIGIRRTMTGPAVGNSAATGGSALPRVQTQGMRSVSGKPDLAVAGAMASLKSR